MALDLTSLIKLQVNFGTKKSSQQSLHELQSHPRGLQSLFNLAGAHVDIVVKQYEQLNKF